ncbi:RecQ-mediated genome instability protein 2 [Saguinus oedipus]|uniref:RecQ-mediated genome instability protein 2 n=1 Tax=Saguinus oedipus TaxID=9490 RepID=A0ABQ9UXJ1_SAGOE|nr:RecQ-mediated genome instability protein 2 [Saguinus oedipus]
MAAAADSFSGGPTAVRLPRSPPLKVLAEQLRRDAEGGPGAWRLSRAAAGRGPLELAVVWMQGTVVMADRGEARLRDPSGAFSVRGLERVPRGRPCLVPGNARASLGSLFPAVSREVAEARFFKPGLDSRKGAGRGGAALPPGLCPCGFLPGYPCSGLSSVKLI